MEEVLTRLKVFELLDTERGLMCLSRPHRRALSQALERLSDDQVLEFYNTKLCYVSNFINPIAALPEPDQRQKEFSSFCVDMLDAPFECDWPKALNSVKSPSLKVCQRLQVLAALWSSAGLLCDSPSPTELGEMVLLTCHSLSNVGDRYSAARLVEKYLGVDSNWSESKNFVLEGFIRAGLDDIEKPKLQLQGKIVIVLADALRRASGRGPIPAVSLIQSWLQIKPEVFKSTSLCREAFRGDQFQRVTNASPILTANLILLLAMSLRLSPSHGAGQSTIVIEAWLFPFVETITAETYSDTKRVAELLCDPRCPLNQVTAKEIVLGIIFEFADSLRIWSDRGPSCAALLLEGWLRLSNNCDAPETLSALNTNVVFQTSTTETQSQFLTALGEAWTSLQKRCEFAFPVLCAWVGIDSTSFRDMETLAHKFLNSKLTSILPYASGANFVRVFAKSARYAGKLGTRWARLIIETWFQLQSGDKSDERTLEEKLHNGVLDELAGRIGTNVIMNLLLQYSSLLESSRAIAVLESWLGLEVEDYRHTEPGHFRRKLEQSRLRDLSDATNRLNFGWILGERLADVDDRRLDAVCLLLEISEIPQESLSNKDALRREIDGSRPLSNVGDAVATTVIGVLAETVSHSPNYGPACATRICEVWLDIRDDSTYKSILKLKNTINGSRLNNVMDPSTATNFISRFSACLAAATPFSLYRASSVIEVWLEGAVENFAEAERLKGNNPEVKLHLIQQWLRFVDVADSQHIQNVCEAVVAFFRNHRDDRQNDQESLIGKRDFIDRVRSILNDLQSATLRSADSLRERGLNKDAISFELKLLGWVDEFENRLIIERLVHSTGVDLALVPDQISIRPNSWPFRDTWGEAIANETCWKAMADETQEPQQQLATPLCLDSVQHEHEENEIGSATSNEDHHVHAELLEIATRPLDLMDALPENAIWIRLLFDAQGRLRWWACRRGRNGVEVVANDASAPGARGRLAIATEIFDMEVEAVWAAFRGESLSSNAIRGGLSEMAKRFSAVNSGKTNSTAEFATRAQKILALLERGESVKTPYSKESTSRSFRSFAQVGRNLLIAYLEENTDNKAYRELLEKWLQTSTLLQQNHQIVTAEAAIEHERRRRERLDEASLSHLDALEREWDLRTLKSAKPSQDSDLILQRQGPLFSYPLAWVNFNGKHLFEQFASTSTAISIGLLNLSRRERETVGEPQPCMVSVLWEEPNVRRPITQAIQGFPLLQQFLMDVADKMGSQIYCVGDSPLATRDNLVRTLRQISESVHLGLVVIGGHGNRKRPGIRLANSTFWEGAGVDMNRVDLVVLAACAVGRVDQDRHSDIEGLYAEFVAHRGRSMVAAGWPVGDIETAFFVEQVATTHLQSIANHNSSKPFNRARCFNKARLDAITRLKTKNSVSFHVLSAFEFYGLG